MIHFLQVAVSQTTKDGPLLWFLINLQLVLIMLLVTKRSKHEGRLSGLQGGKHSSQCVDVCLRCVIIMMSQEHRFAQDADSRHKFMSSNPHEINCKKCYISIAIIRVNQGLRKNYPWIWILQYLLLVSTIIMQYEICIKNYNKQFALSEQLHYGNIRSFNLHLLLLF